VKTEGHHLAAKLLDRSRKLEESGKATTADVLKAEVALYQRQEEEFEAESIKIDRQNALLLLMADDVATSERSVLPTTGLTTNYQLPERGNLVGNAVENRLDVVYYRKLLERAGHNLVRGKDASKPQINLVATAGVNGLAGDGSGSYSESFGGQGPEFSIGLNFAMPLNGKMRRAEWDMAELELKKAETSLRKQKATVALEIDTALSRARSLLQRVSTAAKAREMAAKNMESEEKLLEEGRSDNFRVLEMQQEYADVCSRQIEAQAELNKSMVGLWLASGQIFEKFSIQFPLATTAP
jgi:outer membrane protein TolC